MSGRSISYALAATIADTAIDRLPASTGAATTAGHANIQPPSDFNNRSRRAISPGCKCFAAYFLISSFL